MVPRDSVFCYACATEPRKMTFYFTEKKDTFVLSNTRRDITFICPVEALTSGICRLFMWCGEAALGAALMYMCNGNAHNVYSKELKPTAR